MWKVLLNLKSLFHASDPTVVVHPTAATEVIRMFRFCKPISDLTNATKQSIVATVFYRKFSEQSFWLINRATDKRLVFVWLRFGNFLTSSGVFVTFDC